MGGWRARTQGALLYRLDVVSEEELKRDCSYLALHNMSKTYLVLLG